MWRKKIVFHQPRRFSSCITSCSWTQCGKETMKVLQYDGTNWFNGSASKKCLWSDYKVITHNKIATISCVALYMSTIGVLIAAERMTQIPTDTSSHIPSTTVITSCLAHLDWLFDSGLKRWCKTCWNRIRGIQLLLLCKLGMSKW